MTSYSISIDGVSEQEVQETIKKNTKGFRLFFHEPEGMDYSFINTFWGASWDGTASNLKDIILSHIKVDGINRHFILIFKLDGLDRFAYCSWTKQLYDFSTEKYYQLVGPKLSRNIADIINEIMN